MLDKILIRIAIFASLIIILTYSTILYLFLSRDKIDTDTLGVIGDSIGGSINPILTFFSFIAILYTIFLQSKELSETREELSRSADAQEKNLIKLDNQIKAQNLLKFENTFFSFLNHHNNIIQQLTFTPSPAVANSNGIVKHYTSAISKTYQEVFLKDMEFKDAREFLTQKEKNTDHYFRLVYQILKFIDLNYPGENNQEKFSTEQRRYSSILRASIEHRVLELIAINGASTDETPSYYSYKRIIEKSSFLEHLKFNHKIIDETKNIYSAIAFGESIYLNKQN